MALMANKNDGVIVNGESPYVARRLLLRRRRFVIVNATLRAIISENTAGLMSARHVVLSSLEDIRKYYRRHWLLLAFTSLFISQCR